MLWDGDSGMVYKSEYGCELLISTPTTVVLNPTQNVTMSTPFIAADWYIKVVWASSDLDLFSPASAPLLGFDAETASTITASATSFPSSGTTDPTNPPSNANSLRSTIPPRSTVVSSSTIASSSAVLLSSSPSAISTATDPSNTILNGTTSPNASPTANTISSLPTAAQAGIGIGAGILGAALLGLALFIFIRRKRSTSSKQPLARDSSAVLPRHELDSSMDSQMFEADNTSKLHEADGASFRAELEGSWHGHEMRGR